MKKLIALLTIALTLSAHAATNELKTSALTTVASPGTNVYLVAVDMGASNTVKVPITAVGSGTNGVAVYRTLAELLAANNPSTGNRNVYVRGLGQFYATNSVTGTNLATRIFSGTAGWSYDLLPQPQLLLSRTNLGTSASVTVDPRIRFHDWNPSTNCSFAMLSGAITDTNSSVSVYLTIKADDPITVTNTTDTLVPLGNWGSLAVGYNTLELHYQAGRWSISQDSARLDATQIKNVTGQTGEGEMVQNEGPEFTHVIFQEKSTEPSTPTAGKLAFWMVGDNLYTKNSDGTRLQIQTEANDPEFSVSEFLANGTTTGATATPIWSAGLSQNKTLGVTATVLGAGPSGLSAQFNLDSTFRRDTGSAAIVGSNNVTRIRSDSAVNSYFSLDGNEVKLYVVGKASSNMTWQAFGRQVQVTNIATIGGYSPFFLEQFENATDYDNTGWTAVGTGGTVNPNYTSTILDGSESLYLLEQNGEQKYIYKDFASDHAILYGFMKVRVLTRAGAINLAQFWSPTQTALFTVSSLSSGELKITHGTNSVTSVATMSVGTTYNIWWYYNSDGHGSAAFSDDGVAPISGDAFISLSNGSAGDEVHSIVVGFVSSFTGANEGIFDDVVADTSQVPNNAF